MELQGSAVDRHRQVLMHISSLPRKILSLYDRDNVTEFVLHDLCGPACFNLERAAYLVGNGSFNFLKGIAGYCRYEAFNQQNYWDQPADFTSYMSKQNFNKKVRSVEKTSFRSDNMNDVLIREIADQLAIKQPGYYVFNLKHDNNGLFLFEQPTDQELTPYIPDALYLLSFCPVF